MNTNRALSSVIKKHRAQYASCKRETPKYLQVIQGELKKKITNTAISR